MAQSRPLLPNQFPISDNQIEEDEALSSEGEEPQEIAFEMSPAQLLYTPTASVGYLWLKRDQENSISVDGMDLDEGEDEQDDLEESRLPTIQVQLKTARGHEGLVMVQREMDGPGW